MTQSSNGPHKKARIEIIPLIDIMFFLLASFMLVSMSMIKLQKINVELPGARSGSAQQKQDFTVVGVNAKGDIYFGKDQSPVSADEMVNKLTPVYNQHKDDTKVFINCSKEATYDQLVTVLDAIRGMGIKKVFFAVKKESGPTLTK